MGETIFEFKVLKETCTLLNGAVEYANCSTTEG